MQLIGQASDEDGESEIAAEIAQESRFRWVGALSHEDTHREIALSGLIIIPSRSEGSSNVLSEALANGVPVICTRIPGLRGTLGDDYPGYFPPGDAVRLARLIEKFMDDPKFRRKLSEAGSRAAELIRPVRERAAWQAG